MPRRAQLGHFVLREEIAHGGMGTIFRAFDPTLNREVAIKVLREDLAADPKFVEEFLREARNAAAISHPHIVQVHFVGEQEGEYYIVLELLEGRNLRDIIEKDGPIPEEQALDYTIQAAEALRAAYRYSMIHGDIKPANLFVTSEGVKVLDFGLSKLANVEVPASGEIWGSPYYISPERVGQKAEDFRSDIYSLGATLFHMLTGRPPFDANDIGELALKRLNEKPPLLRSLNPEITERTEEVVNKMLNKSPLLRYRDYDHLLEDLREARTAATAKRLGITIGFGAEAEQPKPPQPAQAPPTRRLRWPLVVGGLILVAIAAGIAAYVHFRLPPPPTPQPPPTPAPTQPTPPPPPPPPPAVTTTTAPPVDAEQAAAEEEARRAAEAARLAAERERQARIAAEKKRVQAFFGELSALLAAYDYVGARDRFNTLLNELQTPEGKQLLHTREALVRYLVMFQTQLGADVSRQPYPRGDLETRSGGQLMGRVTRVTPTQIVVALPYGEIVTTWPEIQPASVVRMAEYYAAAARTTEPAGLLAQRYLAIAAFCKQVDLPCPAAAYAREALKHSTAIEADVKAIFGKIPDLCPPPRPVAPVEPPPPPPPPPPPKPLPPLKKSST